MVLFDRAKVTFSVFGALNLERHKRVKIFNERGKEHGSIKILYDNMYGVEHVYQIEAQTINLENGKIVVSKIDPRLIYAEHTDRNKDAIVLTFPLISHRGIFKAISQRVKAEINELNMDLEYDKFCDVLTGDKQFYKPRVFDLWALTVPVLEKRRADYYFEHPMEKSCVTTIDIPTGFEVEALPINASLKFSYGNYEMDYVYNKEKNQVVSTAKFVLSNQVIPAEKYTEMQQYMDAIAKAQNKKLVIKKKA